jgi:hypothetical protein
MTDTHDFFVVDEDGLDWPYILVGVTPTRGKVALSTHTARAMQAMQALQRGIEEFDAYLVGYAAALSGAIRNAPACTGRSCTGSASASRVSHSERSNP